MKRDLKDLQKAIRECKTRMRELANAPQTEAIERMYDYLDAQYEELTKQLPIYWKVYQRNDKECKEDGIVQYYADAEELHTAVRLFTLLSKCSKGGLFFEIECVSTVSC